MNHPHNSKPNLPYKYLQSINVIEKKQTIFAKRQKQKIINFYPHAIITEAKDATITISLYSKL
ncbi:hypothetical protein LSO10F_140011 [Candidatus Liberibacter solanacearum]